MTDLGFLLFQEAMINLKTGREPAEDFPRRSLDFTIKNLSNYRCRLMPSPPQEVEAYHQETVTKREQLDRDGFWRNSAQAAAWLRDCDKVSGRNRGNYGLLQEAFSSPCATQGEKQAIRKMMVEYTDFLKKECERAGYRPLLKEEPREGGEVILDQDALDAVSLFEGEISL